MLIDITLPLTKDMRQAMSKDAKKAPWGHLGTHFDVMDQEFPLSYTTRQGWFFDISHLSKTEVRLEDIDITKVKPQMFIGFYSGFSETCQYGTDAYFREHPQLSHELINFLVSRQISLIGLDFAGMRRGKEHTPKDKFCADQGVFVVENLWGLKPIINQDIIVHTYPLRLQESTGLPCRVIAEIR